jgi:hypothetical protein
MGEQMRILDSSIDAFIYRYNLISLVSEIQGVIPARQTLILFPGGMASKLRRAKKAWDPAGPASQIFKYDTVFGDIPSLLGGAARDLRMHKTATGEYRDKGNRVVIADGVIELFGISPYLVFTAWCTIKQIDWFVLPFDWRRSVDEVGTFFVDTFLPHFQERVQTECNNADPLADYSLIGHSAGGMVVNWLLRNVDPLPGTVRKFITVAAPFYGYARQLHRWFEGESLVNGGGVFTNGIIKALSSFPACYSWNFLPLPFYEANEAHLKYDDPVYPLAAYPSVDFATKTPVDTYAALPPGQRYPTHAQTGFDYDELTNARNLFNALTSPLSADQAAMFVNIRGDTTANNTLNTTTWTLVPPISPSPIADTTLAPGDDVQPAWSTRDIGLASLVPGNVITLKGADTTHMFIMDSPQTIAKLAAVLGIP